MASSSKEKAVWTAEDVETFCKLCVEQIDKGNRPATNKRDGWTVIINKFEELRGKRYDKRQMKSKWDNLKEEWKRWRTLVLNETGLGWDARKKTIDASDEWWEAKIQANPKVKVFRTKGISPDLQLLLDRMYRDIVATGGVMWNPRQGLTIDEDHEPTQVGNGEGIEGAGSTDDDVAENIVGSIGTQTLKRAAQTSTRQAQRKKEKGLTPEQQLGIQIDRLCSAVESRSVAAQAALANDGFGPFKDLIHMLDTIPEIAQDEDLYFFAIDHFREEKENRQIFMSLNSDAMRVKYLKREMRKLSDRQMSCCYRHSHMN